MTRLKVAVCSHSCVIDVNQYIYASLVERHHDIDVLVVAPRRWTSALRRQMQFQALPQLADAVAPLQTRFIGSLPLHWYPRLGRILAEYQPDVIYADEDPHSVVCTQALNWSNELRCRFVFCTKQNLRRYYPPPFSWMHNRVLARADHAVAISAEAERILRTLGYDGDISIVPHDVDPHAFAPQDTSELARSLGLQSPVIGYVGRITAAKGVWDLLEATRSLLDRYGSDFTVLVIGEGAERSRLQRRAEHTMPRQYHFLGSIPHKAMPRYLNLLDILVLPSRTTPRWKEQFGRVLIEAAACGVPLVGSDSGQIPVTMQSLQGGLLFEEGNAEDLAEKLQTLLENPGMAEDMARRGRQAAVERYSSSRVSDMLYSALVEATAPRQQ